MIHNDAVILVTGSSRGIGAALVEYFVRRGFRAVINYATSEQEAQALHTRLEAEVGADRVLTIQADVSQRADVRRMFASVIARFGRVDVLINNAGLNLDGPFLTMTDEQWRRVQAINLDGPFFCSQEFALRFQGACDRIPCGHIPCGHIINIGASTGLQGRKNGANYCSAKAGVMTLTKCLALELAPEILVNCIVPGYIDTEEVLTRYHLHEPENYDRVARTIPLARLGTPDDICRMAGFLVENATYITGQNIFVNGGNFWH